MISQTILPKWPKFPVVHSVEQAREALKNGSGVGINTDKLPSSEVQEAMGLIQNTVVGAKRRGSSVLWLYPA
jgi:hypothetical protein